MHTLPSSVQDFIARNFTDADSRTAKTKAAQETYESLWAEERGDMFPEELSADVCQALLLDGEDMVIKLAVAVRDCIDREDAGWSHQNDEAGPEYTPTSGAPLTPEIATESPLNEIQNTASAIDQAVMDAEDIFRDLGRLEGISFVATVADVAAAQIFEKIKKNKSYKNIPYFDEAGNRQYITDLEEFCRIKLGKSYSRVKQLSQNLRTLGPDLYESAERIGFRAKDYRALKALPAEEQAVVKQAIESESKDEVLGILEDMAARNQAEREAAKKREEDLTADYEARGKLLEDKGEQLEQTKEELFKLKSLPKDADLELKLAREEEAVERLHREHVTFLTSSKVFLQAVSEILGDGDVSAHTKEHAVFEVRQVAEAFNQFLLDCSIPVDFTEIVYPEWAREQAAQDIEAGSTEEPNGAHGSW